jgi:outer membrane protein TolC
MNSDNRKDVLSQQDAYQTANQKLLQAQQDLTLLRHEIAVALDLDFEKVVIFFKNWIFSLSVFACV